ncbi:MAG: ATP-grasp domain-containing protein, partial [Enterococcus sp.]|nr:ATP-grasp domain-containing protein [Enterococcus sp.]
MEDNKYVLMLDPFSTSTNYLVDIQNEGYIPICYITKVDHDGRSKRDYTENILKPLVKEYGDSVTIIYGTGNYEKDLEKLSKYKFCAVIPGTEPSIDFANRFAKDFGLPGNPVERSNDVRNKDHMQKCIKDAGLRSICGKQVKSLAEAEEFLDSFEADGYIVKTVDGTASVGLSVCSTKEEVLEAVKESLGQPYIFSDPSKGLMIQEKIDGTEYVVNAVCCEGRHAISDVWQYEKVDLGTDGRIYDCIKLIDVLKPEHIELCQYALYTAESLGIKYGAMHGEFMIDEKGPVLIEAAARPMGGNMLSDYLDACLGHHITNISLDSYLFPEIYHRFYNNQFFEPNQYPMAVFMLSKEERDIEDLPLNAFMKNLRS